MVEGAGEPVEHHGIHDLLVADAVPGAGTGQEVGGVGHGLHTPGDDDVGLARADHEVGEVDRLQPRETDLVDGGRVHGHRDTALDGRLARRDLTLTGLDDLAHQHRVDRGGVDAGLVEHALDGGAPEVGRAQGGEHTREFSDGGATSGDDDTARHDGSFVTRFGTSRNDRPPTAER